MCGVLGLISRTETGDILSFLDTLKHRGPDAQGTFRARNGDWHVAFGHRRLSIIDLEGGAQPMSKGNLTTVYNGEIYNYRQLALENHLPLITHSDTETLVELFRRDGVGAFSKFDGFFACGIFDASSGELTLARDSRGIKPLYWSQLPDGGILFASELSPFLRHTGISKTMDLSSIQHYLFWDHFPSDECALSGVHKLRPGHCLTWREGRIETKPFEDLHSPINQKRH